MNDPRGSVWRKWDLQVHAPGDHLNDGYKTDDGSSPLDRFCKEVEHSDVDVIGITDYFAFESVDKFFKRHAELYPDSTKSFFFDLELRINETVNRENEEVNVHLIFNPASLEKVPTFLSRLKVVKTGEDEVPITCSQLATIGDFASATVTRANITQAFEETFGKRALRSDHFIVMTAANNDGLRPTRGAKRKEQICDEIDKFSDGFFGGRQNIDYYLHSNRYEDDQVAIPKPTVATSDCHSFEDLEQALGRQRLDAADGTTVLKDVTWIKADPTYEGLKQILYEPWRGERISIGPVEPDQKEPYMTIRKIRFSATSDFPDEIEFNSNLSSIVGSRSSGKSALLAYIADAVDSPMTRKLLRTGPGAGFSWERVDFDYEVEWGDGRLSSEVEGRVLFVPQNLLFLQGQDPTAIKDKIEPILLKAIPTFGRLYEESLEEIDEINDEIRDSVSTWFDVADEIDAIAEEEKKLGSKGSIGAQRAAVQASVDEIGAKAKLNDTETAEYQKITSEIRDAELRVSQIDEELQILSHADTENDYFRSVALSFKPSMTTLPEVLIARLNEQLEARTSETLSLANKIVVDYKKTLESERRRLPDVVNQLKTNNKPLLEKYGRNEELKKLVKQVGKYDETLRKLKSLAAEKKQQTEIRKDLEAAISAAIQKRERVLAELPSELDTQDQSGLEGIVFGIEVQIDDDERLQREAGINVKQVSDFVKTYKLNLDAIRSNPASFLKAIHDGSQKIVKGFLDREVAADILTLTESVLLTGEMEGDRIGGFSESTMTPGKRALFALRLILLESEDKWPILIDQPEDDLDSRSIYDEIVPFLKSKKKERQIIMVSHNANLVIGSDSEQLVITNRHGSDRPNEDNRQFNYLTGSLEFTKAKDEKCADTLKAQGTCEHACAILDGGKHAFEDRKKKYNIR